MLFVIVGKPASFTGGECRWNMNVKNIGNGVGVFADEFGKVFQFRSLTGINGITVNTNFDGTELQISSNHATNTDGLFEGTNNLYYSNNRVTSHIRTLSINEHVDVDTIGIQHNNVLVWSSIENKFKPATVPIDLHNRWSS